MRATSTTEAIGGVGAIILAVIALCGVLDRYLGPIAVIAVGGALFIEGGATGSRYLNRLRQMQAENPASEEIGLGMTVEFLAGAAGVVLGILAIAGVAPATLMAVAVLAFGAALALGSGPISRSSRWVAYPSGPEELGMRHVMGDLANAAAGAQLFLGFAAVVLGVLALVGLSPFVLEMAGILCVACSITFTGTTMGSKMVSLLHG